MLGAILALFLACPASAQELYPATWKPVPISQWGGLNLSDDSTEIGNDAQVARNIITENGYLELRPGNVLLTTILDGYPTLAIDGWVAPSGSRYLIAQASQTVYQTDFSGSPVALSSVTVGYTLNTLPAFSRIYFSDGAKTLWYWDETSTETVTGAPICTYLAYKDARIFCGNIPDEGSSRVRVSSEGGGGYWVVPSDVAFVDNAPNVFDFTPDDGDSITCLFASPWGVFVGKRNSSHMIKGNGNLTYDLRSPLDPNIGCVDNRSVQMVNGVLTWLSLDGVYGYDGTGPPHILSDELDPLTDRIRQSIYIEGQWATQLQVDWQAGYSTATSWNADSLIGLVFPSSFTLFDDNTDPSAETGFGFSSGTLIEIDTVTYPTSMGLIQISSIIVVDNFSDGDYESGNTTWTVTSSPGVWSIFTSGDDNYVRSVPVGQDGGITAGDATIHSTHFSTALPGPFSPGAVIAFRYKPHIGSSYPYCLGTSVGKCFDFKFMIRPDGDFYSLRFSQTGAGGAGKFEFVRSTSSTEVIIASTNTVVANDTPTDISIHRDLSGNFGIYRDNEMMISSSDTVISSTTHLEITAYGVFTTGPLSAWSAFTNINLIGQSGQITSRIFDTEMSTPVPGTFSSTYTLQGQTGETAISFYMRTSTSPNNDMWSSWHPSSNSVNVSTAMAQRYQQYQGLLTTNVSSHTPQLISVQLAFITTGYYNSKVQYIGTNITDWKQFAVTQDNPGVYDYDVRTATFTFDRDNTAISWVNQTANQNVAAATGTYAQFRLDSTGLMTADDAETISGVFLRWSEGANIPVASASLNRQYILCVTISTAATVPDTCLIRQKTNKWVEWSGPDIGALGIYNNNIIAADGGTSSKVWEILQSGVHSDDGVAIDAEWVTRDFTSGIIFNDKVFHEAWVDALPVSVSSITFSYAVDKSSAYVDYEFTLDNGSPVNWDLYPNGRALYGDINQHIPLVEGYETGKYFRFKISTDDLNNYFRINAYLIYFEDQPRSIP